MFGNRTATAASILQKTYDESYLMCSTAVYYEGQGDEAEAMRCWKQALEQIYDHNANRLPPAFTPRSDTEKALVDSIRQLELQCKERIDLLEALRLSRQEAPRNVASPSDDHPNPASEDKGTSTPREQGWIGDGTIPAVTYTELARPDSLRRRPGRSRTSTSAKSGDEDKKRPAATEGPEPLSPSPSHKPPFSTPSRLSPDKKSSRTSSPERHTMRTTLRTGHSGEKSTKIALRRPTPKAVDGPGKAALLAWSLLGNRDTAEQGSADRPEPTRQTSNPPTVTEPTRRSSESPYRTWDSNSRRLTTSRTRSPTKDADRRVSVDLAELRQTESYMQSRPSPLSVSAASSALNSLTLRDSREQGSPVRDKALRRDQLPQQRAVLPRTPQARKQRDQLDEERGLSDVPKRLNLDGRTTSSDSATVSRRVSSSSRTPSAAKPRSLRTPSGSGIGVSPAGSRKREQRPGRPSSPATSDLSSSSLDTPASRSLRRTSSAHRHKETSLIADSLAELSDSSTEEDENAKAAKEWKRKKAAILKKLPPGVDQHAAKQILNEIVVRGDEVHWSDIAGLEVAKNALRETVVYPFLRPDLFMGLREPARGMLLFGPPGTGKTMLARAVATESKSTFFSISASSLTSKYLGESEKLVRALFSLAKVLAPSIIFVDEIDSLLSQRSGTGEHEATRRIKTEFLIQWSDLQRAAAGREPVGEKEKERGDANRVLVLAATNLPWAIDEAARRRFVRRQYIPLPEPETRKVQIMTLLKQQQHTLSEEDIDTLVGLTDGFSGSDITALAKDAAMGPLRSLGDALLHMTMEEIRPIELSDFVASLATIRPSVSKTSLKEYEDWAREFGERGG
ncbi:hypothetical protein VTJ83DRAFT_3002 [Remersonia thermophila]|uniref:AAA+ ATPase domain-containing protein n=1 Tax=Remersonia thermophila TaxID=72144 RepID=A0ABR4DCU4_9PEZI